MKKFKLIAGSPLAHVYAMKAVVEENLKGIKIYVIDAGLALNPYFISQEARFRKVDSRKILKSVKVARAFNPYQIPEILKKLRAKNISLFIMDALTSVLHDPNLHHNEKKLIISQIFQFIDKILKNSCRVFLSESGDLREVMMYGEDYSSLLKGYSMGEGEVKKVQKSLEKGGKGDI